MSAGQVDGVAVDEGVAVAASGVAVTTTISGSEGAQPIATTATASSTISSSLFTMGLLILIRPERTQ